VIISCDTDHARFASTCGLLSFKVRRDDAEIACHRGWEIYPHTANDHAVIAMECVVKSRSVLSACDAVASLKGLGALSSCAKDHDVMDRCK